MFVAVLSKRRARASISLPQNDSCQVKPSMPLLTAFEGTFL